MPTIARGLCLAMLLVLLGSSRTEAGPAEDRRRFRALEALTPGMSFAQMRRRVMQAGWYPRRTSDGTVGRCDGQRRVCLRYPETSGCSTEDSTTRCGFEFLDTARRPPRLDDEVLRVLARVGPDGALIYESHVTTSFAGPG